GTAVARGGLAYAFDALGLETVWAEALSTNHASVHILERLGMVHDGHGGPGAFLGVPDRYVRFRMSRTLHAATRATGPLTQRLRIPWDSGFPEALEGLLQIGRVLRGVGDLASRHGVEEGQLHRVKP